MINEDIFLGKRITQKCELRLPASKSINNRAAIISELAGGVTELLNPSNARDSVLMSSLIKSDSREIDARDAGTTFRFLTAYFSVLGKQVILTGTERMKKRPIGILVDALRKLGADISYIGEEGFPPLRISGFSDSGMHQLSMRGDVSSQYISAILMISPVLGREIEIELTGKIGSKPYIEMTLSIMRAFGTKADFTGNKIRIGKSAYTPPSSFEIEPDWSAASYWYSLVSIAGKSEITLQGLKPESLQGDSVIADIMKPLGVESKFHKDGVTLKPVEHADKFSFDFTHCPDLAQTVAVVCAAKGIQLEMSGLESLRIKETDRILALQKELSKFGIELKEKDDKWIIGGSIKPSENTVVIETYEDHRMAMAFAPLSLLNSLEIRDRTVVNKSYPHFWEDFDKATIPSGN